MRIGILTFTNTSNYGASLQAYALQQVVKSHGHECDIIKYENKSVAINHDPRAASRRKGIKKIVSPIVYYVYKKRIELFRIFEYKYCTFSRECNEKSVAKIVEEYDRIIVGSDQVWNTELTHGDKTYFLEFLRDNKKKYSYAASIGKEYFDESDAIFKSFLKDFKVLSCREKETAKRLRIDLSRADITYDVDPTFLIRDKWQGLVKKASIKGDYIFMYFVPEEKVLIDKVKRFAKKEHCKIILLKKGAGLRKGIKVINIASPVDFINYIAYAKYVITGSYHALCFSLMFEKNVFATPSIEKNRSGRLVQLLNNIGLEDRMVIDENRDFKSNPIDYKAANVKLNLLCERSLRTIEKILS